jgi:hypothetical protein
MFDELENMVQNLGNSYIANQNKQEETKVVEYNDTESQSSNDNNYDVQAFISK